MPASPVPRNGSVQAEMTGAVLVVALNRPDAMNAVNSDMATALGYVLAEAEQSRDVRAIVLTGTGRAFCAGMDLIAFARGEQGLTTGHPEWGFAGMTQHLLAKPVIAAVNGPAMGGGCELVLACDLAIASTAASFGLSEVKRGLIAGGGGIFRLARVIGRRAAAEMILTGAPISAETALAYGLVNDVVGPDDMLPAALRLAESITANAPLAVQVSKRLLHDSFRYGSDWDDEIWRLNDEATAVVLASADSQEGALAFAEKRPPRWTGR